MSGEKGGCESFFILKVLIFVIFILTHEVWHYQNEVSQEYSSKHLEFFVYSILIEVELLNACSWS